MHKAARITVDYPETGVKACDVFTSALFSKLLAQEYAKLLKANNKDVYDLSKTTTLPISREIVEVYVLNDTKLPWFIDLLNINLNNTDLDLAKDRINLYVSTFMSKGVRITENLDFKTS